MIKVVGFETKKGSFTNQQTGEVIDYDNLIIYYVSDLKKEVEGLYSSEIKIKSKDIKKILGDLNPSDLLDEEIIPYYIPVGNSVVLYHIDLA